jgi:hypothetical protein
VHDAEDRRRRADAERERDRRDEGEAGIPEQLPDREREVLTQLGEVLVSAHGVIPLVPKLSAERLRAVEIAEARERRAARLFRRHAARDILADAHFEVKGDLVGDLVFHLRLPQPRPQQ